MMVRGKASAEELSALRDVIREFGRKEIRPRIVELEKKGEFPRELYRRLGEIGAFGCARLCLSAA